MPNSKTSKEHLERLRAEAASLKAKLDEVNAKIVATIAGKTPSQSRIEPLTEDAQPPFRPRRVLIIEDEPEARALLNKLVTRFGHEVEVAENGMDGLAKLQQRRPDIALIDLGLPDLDGYSVARRVRASCGADCPFLVAYTAHAGPAIKAAALAAGFDRHVVKPIGNEELMFLLQPERAHL